MTSGHFKSIPVSSITIDRSTRQRREIKDEHIADLADSIQRLGLIHPLVIDREHNLVAGECRLTAVRRLGWTDVPVQYADSLDPLELKAIELEENVKRKDIDWKDNVRAIAEYHNLKASQNPEWSQTATAESIGLTPAYISQSLNIAKEIESGNKRVLEAPKYSVARGIVERQRERATDQAVLSIAQTYNVKPTVEVSAPESIFTADFNEWSKTYDGPKFNFIHCDFPYGIGADKFNQGSAAAHGGYVDDENTFWRLMQSLNEFIQYHCTDSLHLMFWFAMRKESTRLYEPIAQALDQMGLDVNPLPLIWLKSDNIGILPDPSRGPRQIYETAFFASRGDRKIVSAVSNAYAAPTVRDRHMSEKPEPMLRHFFRMLVDSNTVMLDPTCGSGASLRAADSLGAKHYIGLEINPEFADLARKELKRARDLKNATQTQRSA